MAEADPFARDLGYLAKFLESLRAHAGTLDPARGQRLLALLDEEAERWEEIKRILAGEAAVPARSRPPEAPARGKVPADSPGEAQRQQAGRLAFTVGSLRLQAQPDQVAPR